MKIKVENLGPVKKALIDLDKSFIVFTGHNNTGKTYMAYLIYALTRSKLSIRRKTLNISISDIVEKREITLEINCKDLYEVREEVVSELKSNLDSIFGISKNQANLLFENFTINFDTGVKEYSRRLKDISIDRILEIDNLKLRLLKKQDDLNLVVELIESKDISDLFKDDDFFKIIISSIITQIISFYPLAKNVMFPVERNSINTFSKELSINRNLLIDQMQKLSKGEKVDPFEVLTRSSNRYPIVIKDGLEIADDLAEIQKQNSQVYKIAEELEESLLNGKLSLTKDGDLQFTSNKKKTQNLPIHMTASIVKTLSSLIFYLKHKASKGDLIIIDEPEMNLHPDSQIILARIFAKLHSLGFRFIISTHSDYVIREINNLIMISSNKQEVKDVAENLGYHNDEVINGDDVACYFFHYPKENSRQVSVDSVLVSQDGFQISSIDKEISDQNDRMQELYYSMLNEE